MYLDKLGPSDNIWRWAGMAEGRWRIAPDFSLGAYRGRWPAGEVEAPEQLLVLQVEDAVACLVDYARLDYACFDYAQRAFAGLLLPGPSRGRFFCAVRFRGSIPERVRMRNPLLFRSLRNDLETVEPSNARSETRNEYPYAIFAFATSSSPSSSMLCSRISTLRILPVTVIGNSSVNLI